MYFSKRKRDSSLSRKRNSIKTRLELIIYDFKELYKRSVAGRKTGR
ncbi:hypothetical protein NMS_1636 [Nonlabens marinus S1-08]|uniref:Uncharacterized protein n=1 Tax=Nonlabens marinus S1-08 TaxID=1454201 RepID=W8VRH0_9FLAO|nr:hypothetical protein NMS_1636 [Nonlabens marinus S1-08]